MKTQYLLLAFFCIVTAIYTIANPFLIIVTNIVWSHVFERDHIQPPAVMIALYVLPMLPIFLTSLGWYFLALRRYRTALIFLMLPATFILGYLYIEPLIT
jgi:hypothetical protein